MDTLKFVMTPDVAEVVPAVLGFNFEEMKTALQERMKYYGSLVITEDAVKEAKADRAELRRLREALEAKRREVKMACLAPYNDFEAKVKILVGLVDEPIAAIDGQVKHYEEIRRNAKREEIAAFFQETAGELKGLVPLEAVWKEEWLNVTCSMKKVKEEIGGLLVKIRSDLKVLGTVEAEYQDEVKVKYLEALDVSAALAHRHHLKEQAQKLREALLEGMPGEGGSGGPLSQPAADSSPKGGASGTVEERVYLLRFECQITKAQAAVLARFMKENDITYRRI